MGLTDECPVCGGLHYRGLIDCPKFIRIAALIMGVGAVLLAFMIFTGRLRW